MKLPADALRINVVGSSGSGKSTFARELSQRLGVPYVEMDKIFWKPNWTWSSDEEFFSNLEKVLDPKGWVLDGNYTRTIPTKWKDVQVVIWLDYSFARTLWQVTKRALTRSWKREELWEGTGNRESFSRTFLNKDSIIWWMITNYKRVRQSNLAHMQKAEYAHITFIQLKSHQAARELLQSIEMGKA